MRKTFTLLAMAAMCCASAFATSKGENVSALNVFSGKLIKTISEPASGDVYTFNYNEKGQLVSATLGGAWSETTTFDYSGGSAVVNYDVKMKIVNPDETMELYLSLNDRNFVYHVYQETTPETGRKEIENWNFSYNADGQLVEMSRTEGDREISKITYADGSIVKVEVTDDTLDQEIDSYAIGYADALPNKSGIMFFDATFCIDMDEMGMAYFAGMLGKPSKLLPQSSIDSEQFTETYAWTVEADGYPSKLTITSGDDVDSMEFAWIDASDPGNGSLQSVAADGGGVKQPVAYFTLQGVSVNAPARGLHIVKHSDGTASKVFVK